MVSTNLNGIYPLFIEKNTMLQSSMTLAGIPKWRFPADVPDNSVDMTMDPAQKSE